MSSFVHLHLHTGYSFLDGAVQVKDLIKRAGELGMPAVAITDHGSMHGIVEFYLQARPSKGEQVVKPIIGCEVYVATRTRHDREAHKDNTQYHLVLLARNQTGYGNLLKIVTKGHTEGFYYKPRVDRELLETYSEGLIALSGCLAGEVPACILNGEPEKARETAREYARIFGRDNYYIELQDQGLPEQKKLNAALIELARAEGLPLVATNDVHYLNKEDAEIQDVLLCIQTQKSVYDEKRLRFDSPEFYFKDGEEMAELFRDCPDAIENTVKIAEACNVELDFDTMLLPHYELPPGMTDREYLRKVTYAGLKNRFPQINRAMEERLDYELKIIEQMGYSSYFLIVWDFVKYARENNIMVGPGRGSAAGSLVSYCLGITNIEPLRYGLLFERFLNPERVSMPDVDIDFCDNRRDEVIRYVKEKYGADRVAYVIAFGTMKARLALRDAGRALDITYSEVDRIAKMIPTDLDMTLKKALAESKELHEVSKKSDEYAKLLKISKGIEGLPRHTTTHAAGVVISKDPLVNHIPLQLSEGSTITQLPMNHLEELGLVKFDFLGLKTLSVIEETLHNIKGRHGTEIDIDLIPDDDRVTYELLSRGETDGVFQLESSGMKNVLRDLRPNKLEDIIAVVALYRPGPMEQIPVFINSKHGRVPVDYPHPTLENILKETYGVIVYQEQIMQIASEMAGFSLGQADILRRAIGKKKEDVLIKVKNDFVEGCIKKGYNEKLAVRIFDLILKFAQYGFNKSHAAAYAVLAYQTAYLKANYQVEYMAALLTGDMGRQDKIALYISDCRRLSIEVLSPHINKSFVNFTVEGDNIIRYGLSAVKNVGRAAIDNIIENRREEPYLSLTDFCSRVDLRACNKKMVESLINAGAFDYLKETRASLLAGMEEAWGRGQSLRRDQENGQISMISLFGEEEKNKQVTDHLPAIPEFTLDEKLAREKEVLGLYISGHPLEQYSVFLGNLPGLLRCAELPGERSGQKVAVGGIISQVKTILTKKGRPMAFVNLEDLTGAVEVIIFTELYEQHKELLQEDTPVIIRGKGEIKEEDDNNEGSVQVKIIAEYLVPIPVDDRKAVIKIGRDFNGYPSLVELRNYLFRKNGHIPVYILFEEQNKALVLSDEYWINEEPGVTAGLERLAGKGNIVFRQCEKPAEDECFIE